MNSNQNTRNVTSISTVATLKRRLRDCISTDDYVEVIHALVATGDRAAIRVLASLLDSSGPIGEESIAGLITFGEAAIPAMRKCIDSLDYEMIRHGHRVLAALGDEASKQWLRDDDVERMHAYLDRKGFGELTQWLFLIANETDEPNEVA
jgi:HEAT repeat protein